MTPPPWELQAKATQYILDNPHCVLDYGLGCGKSRAVIDAWNELRPHLTVVFTSKTVLMQGHWASELEKYGEPYYDILELYKGSMLARLVSAKKNALLCPHNVIVVVNYEALQNRDWVDWAKSADLVVYDEIQKLKSPHGKRSKGAARLENHVPRIVGLSGTLLPHSPLDGFGIFRAIQPDLFGWSFVRYRARFAIMGGFQGHQVLGWQNKEELAEKMGRCTIRATREEMLDLPDATHVRVPVTLSKEGMKAYKTMETAFIAECEAGLVTASNGLVKLLRLQQITTGALKTDTGGTARFDTTKREALLEILESTDEPVVVFGRFVEDMRSVRWCSEQMDERHMEVSGQASDLFGWRAGEGRVLGVQVAAGAEGIDLTRAAICVFLSTGFSLGQYEQALARLHRPGQTRAVTYYHIIARGTVDQYVYNSLRAKKAVVEDVLNRITRKEPV